MEARIVSNWICINFARNIQDSVARTFSTVHAQMSAISGMVFKFETMLPPIGVYPDQVERVLKGRLHEPMTKLKPHGEELDLLVVILPDMDPVFLNLPCAEVKPLAKSKGVKRNL